MGLLSKICCRSAGGVADPRAPPPEAATTAASPLSQARSPEAPPAAPVAKSSSSWQGPAIWRSSKADAGFAPELCDCMPDDERVEDQCLVPYKGGGEGTPAKSRKPRPDRMSRRQLLQRCYKSAYTTATAESQRPLCQGRFTLVGLILVQMLRVGAWLDRQNPGVAVCGLHFLVVASDIVALGVATPLFVCQSLATCVKGGRAGLMLTLVFALSCVDMGALIAYCFVGSPKPFSPGRRTVLKVAEAYLDMWECTLVASVALHIGLFFCCWRIYKELRYNGLYPASVAPKGFGPKVQEISLFEVLCEIEDVNRLKTGEYSLCSNNSAKV